nr:hypothetical protein BaRGS_027979 [Batillaria attramentaria]
MALIGQLDTVNKNLLYWSKTEPDKPAFIFHNPAAATNKRLVLTRADIFTLASRYAAILHREGIKQGDVVCNTLPNSPERLLTDVGIMLAGAVAMNGIVMLSDGSDFVGSIQRSGCVAVIVDPKQSWRQPLTVLESRLRSRAGHTVDCPDAPLFKTLLFVDAGVGQNGHKPFLEQLRNENESFVADVKPEDRAFIFTSSGSTGFSKLIPRSHAEYVLLGKAFCQGMCLNPDDIFFNDEFFGWIVGTQIFYIATGVTRVCLDRSILPVNDDCLAMKIASSERCTAAFIGPHSLERIQTGGQPVRKGFMELIGKVTQSIVIMYGATETGPTTTKVVTMDNKGDYEDGNNGLPPPGVQIKLVDENQKEVVEPGQTGEVLCRGPVDFTGYLGMDQAAQRNVFTHDDWFRTNDVGFRNDKGELHIVCRKSNAIIYGTFVLYPGWLESRLARCPGVQSVVVVPVPDPMKYQELCACVVPQPGVSCVTEEKIREFCKTLYLDPEGEAAAVPRYCVMFDRFPTTVMGKTDRKAVLTSALRTLGMTHTQPAVVTDNIQ